MCRAHGCGRIGFQICGGMRTYSERSRSAYGTNVEGDWDNVFVAVKQCHETIHDMGAPRISTTIRVGTRTDRSQTMADKIKSVQDKLNSE